MMLENDTEHPLDNSSGTPLDKWQSFWKYHWQLKCCWKMQLTIHWQMSPKIHHDFWGVDFWCATCCPSGRARACQARAVAQAWPALASSTWEDGGRRRAAGASKSKATIQHLMSLMVIVADACRYSFSPPPLLLAPLCSPRKWGCWARKRSWLWLAAGGKWQGACSPRGKAVSDNLEAASVNVTGRAPRLSCHRPASSRASARSGSLGRGVLYTTTYWEWLLRLQLC